MKRKLKMKKQELKKLRDKEIAELKKDLVETRKNLVMSRLERVAGKLKNVHEVKTRQKQVATVLTLIREKELLEKLQETKKGKVAPQQGRIEGKDR